jgi:LEA14-like dessication related protein
MRVRRAVLALGFSVGCAGAPPVAPVAPEALQTQRLTVTEQTLTGFTAEARFELTNSGDTPMQITGATYDLTMDGKPLTSGQLDLDQAASPGQIISLRVPVSAEVVHDAAELKALVARGDTPIPLVMKGVVKITQNGAQTELPYSRLGELRAPRLPVPMMNDTALGRSEQDVSVSFYFGVENQNPFDIKIRNISYRAELDGKEVGSGAASIGDRIPASQTAEYPIQESVPKLDRSKTELPYHFTGTVDLGIVQVPIDLTGMLKFEESKTKHKKHKAED